MKIIRKILTAVMIAASAGTLFGAFTSSAVAAESKAGVAAAINEARKALTEAMELAAKGADQRAVLDALGAAKQYAKEITGDALGATLQKFQSSVRMARGKTRRGDLAGAEEDIKKALKYLDEVKSKT